jgi:hypothetical protein
MKNAQSLQAGRYGVVLILYLLFNNRFELLTDSLGGSIISYLVERYFFRDFAEVSEDEEKGPVPAGQDKRTVLQLYIPL